AFFAQRRDHRPRQRPRGARRAGRGHRSVDLPARARRPLAGLGDPAVVTKTRTLNVMAGHRASQDSRERAYARPFFYDVSASDVVAAVTAPAAISTPACHIRPRSAAG